KLYRATRKESIKSMSSYLTPLLIFKFFKRNFKPLAGNGNINIILCECQTVCYRPNLAIANPHEMRQGHTVENMRKEIRVNSRYLFHIFKPIFDRLRFSNLFSCLFGYWKHSNIGVVVR